jgi:hypothetical protein
MSKVEFVPKRYDDQDTPWQPFGAPNEDEYRKWSPEVCGICCLKMIGDSLGLTSSISLYELTMRCKDEGGFRELADGEIQGVFHRPLLEVAKSYGLAGKVVGRLTINKIKDSLKKERFIILSINKSKISPQLKGGHLILVHSYDPKVETFVVHDSELLLSESGENIELSAVRLEEISNNKGLIIWQGN